MWQIAIHSLQFSSDSELLVTQGLSEDAFSWGCAMELDSRQLFDITLQDDKKDLICGVYELETGTLPSLFDFDLPNHHFKVMVIKWNACHSGYGNPPSFTQACELGIGSLF